MPNTSNTSTPGKPRKPRKSARTAPFAEDHARRFLIQAMGGEDFLDPNDPNYVPDSGALLEVMTRYVENNQAANPLLNLTQDIFKTLFEMLLQAELDVTLGYPRYEHAKRRENAPESEIDALDDARPKNARNGSYKRTFKTQNGHIDINVPRDRNGEHQSAILPYRSRELGDIRERVLSLVAEGYDLRGVSRILHHMLGVKMSHETVDRIVIEYQEILERWQNRTLKAYYPFVFIDCLYVNVRDAHGRAVPRPVYVILGIDQDGKKELLSIEMKGVAESKSDWMNIFDSLRNRGLQDISICCMDGVSGVAEGIKVIFPKVRTQRCIVHLMRNSWKHVASTCRKEWAADCKLIYSSPDLDSARLALQNLRAKWGARYPAAVRFWEDRFDEHVAPLYELPSALRKVVYTTNAIESVNNSLRKVTHRGCYKDDGVLLASMLLRAERVLGDYWDKRSMQNWATIREQLLALDATREIAEKYLLAS